MKRFCSEKRSEHLRVWSKSSKFAISCPLHSHLRSLPCCHCEPLRFFLIFSEIRLFRFALAEQKWWFLRGRAFKEEFNMATYEELTSLMEGCTGSCCFWKRWPYVNFGYTDGIKLFCEKAAETQLFWSYDLTFLMGFKIIK